MSPRVDQRDLAKQQRRHLERHYPKQEVDAFAQIFTQPDVRDEPRFVCADQTQEDHR